MFENLIFQIDNRSMFCREPNNSISYDIFSFVIYKYITSGSWNTYSSESDHSKEDRILIEIANFNRQIATTKM